MLSIFKKLYHNYRRRRLYAGLFRQFHIKQVFDIGANLGKKTKLFLKNDCVVVAVEPNAACYPALNALQKKYRKLQLETGAVFTHTGKGQLHLGNHIEISTLSAKMREVFTVKEKVFWEGLQDVDLLTLQELFKRYGHPDFLKLDCEGSDYDILSTLRDPLPLIEFEYTKPFLAETLDTVRFLAQLGDYRFQFSAYESSGLYFKSWQTAADFCTELNRLSAHIIHGNVYAALHSRNGKRG